jgi:hypothetical protein
MESSIKQPKTSEEITGIARDIIYRVGNDEVVTAWLELTLTRLYYDGVMLGREQAQSIANSSQRV